MFFFSKQVTSIYNNKVFVIQYAPLTAHCTRSNNMYSRAVPYYHVIIDITYSMNAY